MVHFVCLFSSVGGYGFVHSQEQLAVARTNCSEYLELVVMNARKLTGSTLLSLLAACGGSSPFTVNGAIHGSSLKPGDAASSFRVFAYALDSGPANMVVLSSSSELCASVSARREPNSSQFLTLVLSDLSTNPALTVGTYTIWRGPSVAGP